MAESLNLFPGTKHSVEDQGGYPRYPELGTSKAVKTAWGKVQGNAPYGCTAPWFSTAPAHVALGLLFDMITMVFANGELVYVGTAK